MTRQSHRTPRGPSPSSQKASGPGSHPAPGPTPRHVSASVSQQPVGCRGVSGPLAGINETQCTRRKRRRSDLAVADPAGCLRLIYLPPAATWRRRGTSSRHPDARRHLGRRPDAGGARRRRPRCPRGPKRGGGQGAGLPRGRHPDTCRTPKLARLVGVGGCRAP